MNKYTFDKKRALSWSSISSFEYNKEQWFRSYILGERQSSPEMTFGSRVDKRIQSDPNFLPDLVRLPLLQHKMNTFLGDIPLVGLPDAFCPTLKQIRDYKTGKKAWDQKRADETGQLTMYVLLLWLTEKIHPETMTCYIDWLPTEENGDFTIGFRKPLKIYTFKTKRTMKQVLEFCQRVKLVYGEMQEYTMRHE